MWKWAHYLSAMAVSRSKVPLWINFDETSVPLVFKGAVGNVMVRTGPDRRERLPRERHGLRSHRAFFTLVAFICSEPAVQPLLPQVIVVAGRDCSWDTFGMLFNELPDNVFLKRLPKGWNNKDLMAVIAEILGRVLQPFMDRFQPVVCFDTAPCHMHPDVWQVVANHGLYWHIIPAKLTGLLQPCDTHAFLAFKRFLKQGEQDMRLNQDAAQGFIGMCRLVIKGVREILQGTNWLRAFKDDGLCGWDSTVSRYILRELHLDTVPQIMPLLPTAQEIQDICPAGRAVDSVFVLSLQPSAEGHVSPVSAPLSPSVSVVSGLSGISIPSIHSQSDSDSLSLAPSDVCMYLDDDSDDDDGDGGQPPPPPAHGTPSRRMNSVAPVPSE